MNVLVLEDDAHLCLAFSDALEDAGHRVTAVGAREDATAQLQYHDPELLLDLDIHGQSALGIADFAGYAAPDAEAIAVTGGDADPCGDLHRTAHNVSWSLRKPVALADLLSLVSFAERRSRQRAQASTDRNPDGGDAPC